MNKIIAIATFITSSLLFTGPASASDWVGHYTYNAYFGRTAGGSYIDARYDIRLEEVPQRKCVITISGYQTREHLICDFDTTPEKVTLFFKSYTSGSVINEHGVEVYPPGTPLLALELRSLKYKRKLVTQWINLQTLDGKPRKPGVYFSKNKTK